MSDESKASFTASGKRRRLSYQEAALMVRDAFEQVPSEVVLRGFEKALEYDPHEFSESNFGDEIDDDEFECLKPRNLDDTLDVVDDVSLNGASADGPSSLESEPPVDDDFSESLVYDSSESLDDDDDIRYSLA